MYDIANVLKSLGVIKKQKNGLNKNVFLWVGSQGFTLERPHECQCSKKVKSQSQAKEIINDESGSESEEEMKDKQESVMLAK